VTAATQTVNDTLNYVTVTVTVTADVLTNAMKKTVVIAPF
jgi:hypothetical protein